MEIFFTKFCSKLLILSAVLLSCSYISYAENCKPIPFPFLFDNVSGSFKETGSLQEDPYLAFADVMPEPVGGLPSIYKKITYPSIAKSAGLEGKVYLLIFVNENGGVDNVKVLKGLGGGCEEAAIEAVKSVKYTPGKNKGTPVKVKLSLAINFKLK